ncbi:MAG: hypothetical protein J0L97_10880 [Alphaproteobacteria bacterium]|nr:hypothetical protein [Alphaproteobacteria bacterium]
MTRIVPEARLHARLHKIAVVLRFLGGSIHANLSRRDARQKNGAFSEQVPEGITYVI